MDRIAFEETLDKYRNIFPVVAILGASFEEYIVENICTHFSTWEAYYYRDSNQTKVDLILIKGATRIAIEIKHSTRNALNKGSKNVLNTLRPEHTYIIIPSSPELRTLQKSFGSLHIGSLSLVVAHIENI